MLSKLTLRDDCGPTEGGTKHIVHGLIAGSKKYLWTERSMSIAIDYVINGQGGDLPEFE